MDGNFSGYWIAILVFISSFPRTDRLLASVQMSFLSYLYPTSPAPSYKSGIDYCCSFWVSFFFFFQVGLKCTLSCTFLWHRQCFASSCESRFKKSKALPRRAANINTPSSLWHKQQKQTLICTFHCFIHKIHSYLLSPSVSLSVVTHSEIFSQRADKSKEVPLQPVSPTLTDSLSVRTDRWMLNCCLSVSLMNLLLAQKEGGICSAPHNIVC